MGSFCLVLRISVKIFLCIVIKTRATERAGRLDYVATTILIATLVLSVLTLLAWIFGWRAIIYPINNVVPINPLTSIQFVVLSSIIILWCHSSINGNLFSVVINLFVLLNGYVLLDKVLGFTLHLDLIILFRELENYGGPYVLRGMSPATNVCFLLTIASLLLIYLKRHAVGFREVLNIIVLFCSVTVLLTYFYKVPETGPFFLMAPLTALLFFLLNSSILLFQAERGLLKNLVVGYFIKSPLKTLIPFSVLFPVALGYLRLHGEWHHLISTEFGVTFIILSFIIALIAAVILVARHYNSSSKLAEEYQIQANELATANEEMQALMEELQTTNEELIANIEALSESNIALEKANATIAKQKDEWLNRVLDTTNDVVYSFDLTGYGESYLSRSAERVYKEPYDSLINRPYFWLEHVVPEDRALKQASQDRLRKIGQTTCTYRISVGGGEVRWIRDELRLAKDENGNPIRLEGVASDITEEKRQQEELEKFRLQLQTVIANSSDNFVLLNAEAKIVFFNNAFRRFAEKHVGITPAVGMSLDEVVPADRLEVNRQAFERAINGDTVQIFSKILTLPGDAHYYNIRYGPVALNGHITHVTISAFDITEQKLQEAKVEEYRQNLDTVFRTSKDTFLLLDASGNIVLFNDAFIRFILAAGNINPKVGMKFLEVVVPARRKVAAELFKKTLNGESTSVDVEFNGEAGEKIFQYVRYEPVSDGNKVTHVCITGVDITAYRKIESELKRDQYFLEKASESASLGYWTSEPGRVNGKLTWSAEVFRIFGVGADEFDGTNKFFFDRIHPDDKEDVIEVSKQALEGNALYNIDHRIVLPDGSIRWVNERAQVLRDANNQPTLMVGIVQDINERKVVEEVLREYNDRFEILSKATNDAIWDWDVINNEIHWNHGIKSIFGYEASEVASVSLWRTKVHHSDNLRVEREIQQTFENKIVNWTTGYQYLCKDGSYKYVLDRAYVIYKGEQPVRMIGAMQDVTEIMNYRLNLEQIIEDRTRKLNQALLKEKELVDLKGKFISIASHEFRTPLTTISLSAGFLKRYKSKLSSDQLDQKVSTIEKQVQHMTSLLEDVLFVGKVEDGKVAVNLKEMEPDLLKILAEEGMASRKDSGHALEYRLIGTPRLFLSDEKLLRSIIFNLITNAVKFSPNAKKVIMLVHFRRESMSIVVRDEGIGIPEQELTNLFASFSRATNAIAIEGTGLGLLIVKKAANLLKGTVSVRSKVGEGTEFTITLPILASTSLVEMERKA